MSWTVNPVLNRELTERMRGPRAMIMLSIYLGVLGAIILLVYRATVSDNSNGFGSSPVTQLAGVGQSLFEWTLLLVLLLVLFLVPGFTAGSVAGERERQTLLPMQVTLLRPIDIVLGKIGASVMFTLLLVVATLPLLTVSYLIGGIRLVEIFQGLAIVLFTALVVAALSVACSTFMKRVQTATVVSYALVLLLLAGTGILYAMAWQIDASRGADPADPPGWILAANPVVALADLSGDDPLDRQLQNDFGFGNGSNSFAPLSELRRGLSPDPFFDGRNDIAFDQFGNPIGDAAVLRNERAVPLWILFVGVSFFFTFDAVVGSVRRLRAPAELER
ncbi:MAG: ABC transporter permease [Ilumatobacter sp.]|uniref:ABC transporter permease n=1 Tax=Ilumatobacter sp. TaxID=1967498 RepID=UPI003C778F5E